MLQGKTLHERREHRYSCEQRVLELRRQVERRRHSLSKLRERLHCAQSVQETQAAQLEEHRRQLARAEEEQSAAASSLPSVYSGLRTLWQQLRCRRIRMLHEV